MLSEKERFDGKYERVPFSGCWVWTGHTFPSGYGMFSIKSHPYRAHRVSWGLHKGEIPAGLHVLHRCDVPACVNPDHLFLGTDKTNAEDRERKGRSGIQRGEKNHNARLTWENVRDIRTRRVSKAEFARVYGVSHKAIRNILNEVSWRELHSDGV